MKMPACISAAFIVLLSIGSFATTSCVFARSVAGASSCGKTLTLCSTARRPDARPGLSCLRADVCRRRRRRADRMSCRLDHSRAASRDRMRSQGIDDIGDFHVPLEFRSPPKRRPSKADLRAELEAATARISRVIKCTCGHQAVIAVPASKLHACFRCSKCNGLAL